MHELVARYLSRSISRRTFLSSLCKTGLSVAAAESVLSSLATVAHAEEAAGAAPRPASSAVKVFQPSGGA